MSLQGEPGKVRRSIRARALRPSVAKRESEAAVRRAEEDYHRLFDNAVFGVFRSTPAGRLIAANAAVAHIFGYASPADLIGNVTDIARQLYVIPGQRVEFVRLMQEHGSVSRREVQAYRKDRSAFWMSESARAVRGDDGSVLYYEGIIEDVTRRKTAEEALRASERRHRILFENSPLPTWVFDLETLAFLEVNEAAVRHFGYTRDEFLGMTIKDIRHHEDVPALMHDLAAAAAGGNVNASPGRHIKKDGSLIDVEITGRDSEFAGRCSRVVAIRDVTERTRAERLRAEMSRRLIEAQETERRRLARELHDEIGQSLTALKIDLQALRCPRGTPPAQLLDDSLAIVERTLSQVRALSLDLRPPLLDDLGLVAALQWHVDVQARRAGLEPRFDATLQEARLPAEVEIACYRVAQEALTNVVRHARASRLVVELAREDGALRLSVRDDGVGFDVLAARERAGKGGSLGLLSMEERAQLLGGRLEIASSSGRGTEVTAWFPLGA